MVIDRLFARSIAAGLFAAALFAFVWICGPTNVRADGAGVSFRIDADDRVRTISIPAALSASDSVSAWFISRGTMSIPVAAYVEGPRGVHVVLESKRLSGAVERALEQEFGWHEIETEDPLSLNASSSLSGNSGPPFLSPDNLFRASRGIVRKDTCEGRLNVRYLVRMRLSFEAVDGALRADGFTMAAAFFSPRFGGTAAASIKPVSEGRFAPHPLLLMTALGGNEEVTLLRFAGREMRSAENIPVEDYVFYRGLTLTRSPLRSQLSGGGMGVFEISNRALAYSVCFRLARARQRANGYPS